MLLKIIWKRFGQFIKFGLVGCSNTIINLTVYYCGIHFGYHYLIAYTIAFMVSVCNSFFWNNKYVFKNKREKSIGKAFIKVFASYGVSYVISIMLMGFLVDGLEISSIIAPILKLAITVPINYFLNKKWAFKAC